MSGDAKTALAFLRDHHVLSLALVAEGGVPHACSLMYAPDGFTLYWLSDPAARHSQVIAAGGRVPAVATVAPDYTDFRQIRGLQIFGTASRAEGIAEGGQAMARLVGRYGFLASAALMPALASAVAKAVPYKLIPERIIHIDNVRSFGSKVELSGADLDVGAAAHR